jgi:hypothetical protein
MQTKILITRNLASLTTPYMVSFTSLNFMVGPVKIHSRSYSTGNPLRTSFGPVTRIQTSLLGYNSYRLHIQKRYSPNGAKAVGRVGTLAPKKYPKILKLRKVLTLNRYQKGLKERKNHQVSIFHMGHNIA